MDEQLYALVVEVGHAHLFHFSEPSKNTSAHGSLSEKNEQECKYENSFIREPISMNIPSSCETNEISAVYKEADISISKVLHYAGIVMHQVTLFITPYAKMFYQSAFFNWLQPYISKYLDDSLRTNKSFYLFPVTIKAEKNPGSKH